MRRLLGPSRLDTGHVVRFLSALVLAIIGASCHPDSKGVPEGGPCEDKEECRADLTCEYGRCRLRCHDNGECPTDICLPSERDDGDGVCLLPGELHLRCEPEGAGCLEPLYCDEVHDPPECAPPCDPERLPCEDERICVDGRCVFDRECGNGARDPGEQCDDGNRDNTDGCLNDCREARCGDGFVQVGEEDCDDSNEDDTDDCLSSCDIAWCGDGFVHAEDEDCDDENDDNSDGCVEGCFFASCGDGYTWIGHEDCDDGNDVNTDDCVEGCETASCGDGHIWSGHEDCDDGNDDNTDDCVEDCESASCGDGRVWTGHEDCDDGNDDNTDDCVEGCASAECGDGFVWAGHEACDDGNEIDDDACSNDCVPDTCGNGETDAGEECDDGNDDNTDDCLNTCVAASCGDGFVHVDDEECDDGDDRSDTDPNHCRMDCRRAYCGDGVADAGEPCDDGNDDNTDACLVGCIEAECGDGFIEDGIEECDDGHEGNSNEVSGACRTTCFLPWCGDGVIDPGEMCDSGDGCPDDCLPCDDGEGYAGADCMCVRFVDGGSAAEDPDGLTWGSAFRLLREAADSAREAVLAGAPICQVWVAAGNYYSDIDTVDEEGEYLVELEPGVSLFGGFLSGMLTHADRNHIEHATVLYGTDAEFEDFNACHVILVSGGTEAHPVGVIVDGIQVQYAGAILSACDSPNGAGMLIHGTGVMVHVSRSIFYGNSSDGLGGAIAVTDLALLVLENSVINDNLANDGGGLAIIDSARALVINSTFRHNTTARGDDGVGDGAGIFLASEGGEASAEIINSVFDDRDPGAPATIAGENDIFDVAHRARIRYTMINGYEAPGEGNQGDDPLLDSEGRLGAGSPAFDIADACEAPRRDFVGTERVDIRAVAPDVAATELAPPDMGAYEYTGGGLTRGDDWSGECCGAPRSDGDGHTFRQCSLNRPFPLAQRACEGIGGHLATIGSDDEAEAVGRAIEAVAGASEEAWIGAAHFPGTDASDWAWVTEEEWLTPGGASFAEWDWITGCPRTDTGENCMFFHHASFHGCNMVCSDEMAFICETDE